MTSIYGEDQAAFLPLLTSDSDYQFARRCMVGEHFALHMKLLLLLIITLLSSIDTFRVLIERQAPLRHGRILQKVQWHPYQMPFNFIQFRLDFLCRHIFVVYVARFRAFRR